MTGKDSSKSMSLLSKPAGPAVVSILESTAADGFGYTTGSRGLDVVVVVGCWLDSVMATRVRVCAVLSGLVRSTNLATVAEA